MIAELIAAHPQVDRLMHHYGFSRHITDDAAAPVAYLRYSGPMALRYTLRADDTATLEIGLVRTDEATGAQLIRWRRFNTVDSEDATLGSALDAAWFLAAVEGLTPPIVGGRFVFEKPARR